MGCHYNGKGMTLGSSFRTVAPAFLGLILTGVVGCSGQSPGSKPGSKMLMQEVTSLTPSEIAALEAEVEFSKAREDFFNGKCLSCHKTAMARAGVNFENFATLSEEVQRGEFKVSRLYLVYLSIVQNEISEKLNVKKMPLVSPLNEEQSAYIQTWFENLMNRVDLGQRQFDSNIRPPDEDEDPAQLTLLAKSQRLRKLSLLLRGIAPSAQDYEELTSLETPESAREYFSTKAATYMQSPFATRKLGERVLEHLRLPLMKMDGGEFGAPETFNLLDLLQDETDTFSDKTGFHNRIKSQLAQGSSWDQILEGKDSLYWHTVDPMFVQLQMVWPSVQLVQMAAYTLAGIDSNANRSEKQAALKSFLSSQGSDSNLQNVRGALYYIVQINNDLDTLALAMAYDQSLEQDRQELQEVLLRAAQNSQYIVQVTQSFSSFTNITNEKIFSLNGLLSARDVFRRYNKTRYSRSAAFFRIYLCDEMSPAILIDNDHIIDDALDGIHLPGENANAANPPPPEEDLANHSGHLSEACITCHRKLDPIQDLVDGRAQLPNHTWKHDGADGIERSLVLNNKDEFYQQLFKTEQYVRCQTEKMWGWTIGRDVPIPQKRREEIERKFNEVGRRPKDFIAYLTTLPEFYSEKVVSTPPIFSAVQPILKRCADCHGGVAVPNFGKLPFASADTNLNTAQADHVAALKALVRVTALDKRGVGATMPKREDGGVVIDWSLTEGDREDLATWIWHLAKDDLGQPTLTTEQRDEVFSGLDAGFVLKVSGPLVKKPSFLESWKRYLENYDMFYLLRQKFPRAAGVCEKIKNAADTGMSLGFNDTSSGLPNSNTPAVGYVTWTRMCYQAVVENEINVQNLADWEKSFVGRLEIVPANFGVTNFGEVLTRPWMSLEPQHRSELVRRIAHYLLESNTLNAASFETLVAETIARMDMLAQSPGNAGTPIKVFEMVRAGAHNIVSDERFTVF